MIIITAYLLLINDLKNVKLQIIQLLTLILKIRRYTFCYTLTSDQAGQKSKRQTMRQSLKSTPPIIGDVASCIRPEDYLTMA